MFYAHYVLSKKGPLARIWLAAHWDKKLTRNHVFDTNITSSVEAILQPQVKLALRTSGHLLLGVVRIYSRQAKYLLADCNEAFVKIKMAFRPGVEPSAHEMGNSEDVLAAITLQENMRDFESTLADLNDLNEQQHIAMNQSRVEDITMREEFGEVNLGRPDDDFGDSSFVADVREYEQEEDVVPMETEEGMAELVAGDDEFGDANKIVYQMPPSVTMLHEDDFGDTQEDDNYDSGDNFDSMPVSPGEAQGVIVPGSVPGSVAGSVPGSVAATPRPPGSVSGDNVMQDSLFRDTTMGTLVPDSFNGVDSGLLDNTASSAPVAEEQVDIGPQLGNLPAVPEESTDEIQQSEGNLEAPGNLEATATVVPGSTGTTVRIRVPKHGQPAQITGTTVQPSTVTTRHKGGGNVTDFVLPPLRDTRSENRRGPKRKRRLIIDEHKSIPSDVMKLQMQDTSEIMTRLDLAPPTRKLMFWKETGTAEMLLANPGRAIPSRMLQRLFYRNMKTRSIPNDAPGGLPIVAGEKATAIQEEDEEVDDSQTHIPEEPPEVSAQEIYPPDTPAGAPTEAGSPLSAAGAPQDHDTTLVGDTTFTGGAYSEYSVAYDAGAPYTPLPPPSVKEIQPETPAPPDTSMLTAISSDLDEIEKARRESAATASIPADDLADISHGSFMMGSVVNGMQVSDDNVQLQSAIEALDNRMDVVDKEFHSEMTAEGLEKRSEVMSSVLRTALANNKELCFQDLTVSNNKKQAASKFYTLLLLGRSKVIKLRQETPFSNIIITSFDDNFTEHASTHSSTQEQEFEQQPTPQRQQQLNDTITTNNSPYTPATSIIEAMDG